MPNLRRRRRLTKTCIPHDPERVEQDSTWEEPRVRTRITNTTRNQIIPDNALMVPDSLLSPKEIIQSNLDRRTRFVIFYIRTVRVFGFIGL